jgi:hypothetical protein
MMPNDADGRRGFEAVATEGVQVSPPATRRSPRSPDLGQSRSSASYSPRTVKGCRKHSPCIERSFDDLGQPGG